MRKKAVVLFSGGMDSTVALARTIEEGYEPIPLFVNYGQKSGEWHAALKLCHHYRLELREIGLANACFGSTITTRPEAGGSAYVPARNMWLVALAAGLAEKEGAELIVLGLNTAFDDSEVYEDCSSEFVDALEAAVLLASGNKTAVWVPFLNERKDFILREGKRLAVPFQLTTSCYEAGSKPCGKCRACRERAEAFRLEDEARKKVLVK